MKWGDRLVHYYNMLTMGKEILALTREYGNHDIYNFMLCYINGGKN